MRQVAAQVIIVVPAAAGCGPGCCCCCCHCCLSLRQHWLPRNIVVVVVAACRIAVCLCARWLPRSSSSSSLCQVAAQVAVVVVCPYGSTSCPGTSSSLLPSVRVPAHRHRHLSHGSSLPSSSPPVLAAAQVVIVAYCPVAHHHCLSHRHSIAITICPCASWLPKLSPLVPSVPWLVVTVIVVCPCGSIGCPGTLSLSLSLSGLLSSSGSLSSLSGLLLLPGLSSLLPSSVPVAALAAQECRCRCCHGLTSTSSPSSPVGHRPYCCHWRQGPLSICNGTVVVVVTSVVVQLALEALTVLSGG